MRLSPVGARIVGLLLFAHLAPGLDAQSPAAGAPYKPNDGLHRVQSIDQLILHDAKRAKDLPVRITYPAARGSFPLIIFSHGAGGSKDGYTELTRYWASHGYVCIQPTHSDSLSLRKREGPISLRDIVGSAVRDSKGWEGRPRDVSFVIDSLVEMAVLAPQLKGKIDRRRIGVGGHSYGAYTAQLIGGATVDVPGKPPGQSFADRRVRAILVMSGQGRGQQGLTQRSWGALTCPMMTMTGSRDQGAAGQGPDWKKEPFDFAPAGNKYHVFIEGANHFSFSGRLVEVAGQQAAGTRLGSALEGDADQRAVFGYIKMATLAFWDAHLKNQKRALAYLHSHALGGYSQGAVKLFWK